DAFPSSGTPSTTRCGGGRHDGRAWPAPAHAALVEPARTLRRRRRRGAGCCVHCRDAGGQVVARLAPDPRARHSRAPAGDRASAHGPCGGGDCDDRLVLAHHLLPRPLVHSLPVADDRGRAEGGHVTRLGRISYVNMAPVFHRLEAEVEEVQGVPTELNGRLLAGELDVAPISSIEYARNADRLRLLPRLCVSSEGAVDSIQLVARKPLEQVRTVAVTPESATSVVLSGVTAT